MTSRLRFGALALLAFVGAPLAAQAAAWEAGFEAADGVRLRADVHLAKQGKSAPLILLFHQAGGSARGEYGPIVPRLVEAGYSVLAVDLRSGGDRFGAPNRTAAQLKHRKFSYCEAYPDLVAALDYAKQQGFTGPRFVWGSSYSAALVLKLAAERPKDVAGALAFSPASGGPMGDCRPDPFIPRIRLPVLALRPASELEIESVKAQRALLEKAGHQFHVAAHGTHGSSMLVAERVQGDVEPNWKAVLSFLDRVAKP